MTIKAIQRVESSWFTPKAEEGSEAPSRFKLKSPTGAELTQISDYQEWADDLRSFTITSKGVDLALKLCVVDWEGVEDENGKEVAFTPSALSTLPSMVRKEIAYHIFSTAFIKEIEAKN